VASPIQSEHVAVHSAALYCSVRPHRIAAFFSWRATARLNGCSPYKHSPIQPLEITMERFIHNQNLENYRQLIAASKDDPARDEVQHNWLLRLLADEEAKDTESMDR
jgi:hypothetical protein